MDLLPAPASVLDSLGDVSSLCARRELPARGANALLRRNLLVYGLGGLVAPFIGIQLADLLVHGVLGA